MASDINSLLSPQAIYLEVPASSSSDVLTLLADQLTAMGKVTADFGEALIKRESSMPTGLPLGMINVAVPHADPTYVIAPAMAVAILKEPVSFGSMDDPDETIPIKIVIALALKDKDAQIEMLQTIAGLIQRPASLAALAAARTPDDVFANLTA